MRVIRLVIYTIIQEVSPVWIPYFLVQKCPTSLCLSRDETKEQSSKNATLTPTKTLPKK